MKYKKIHRTIHNEWESRRDLIVCRRYFSNGTCIFALSVSVSGFHCLVARYGGDFQRSRNRKRQVIDFWKQSAYTQYSKVWDWYEVQ